MFLLDPVLLLSELLAALFVDELAQGFHFLKMGVRLLLKLLLEERFSPLQLLDDLLSSLQLLIFFQLGLRIV